MKSETLSQPAVPSITPERLAESYRHCEQVARTQARNFYYSFVTLPPERKAAMCAIYAFMRYSDDVSDEAAADHSKAAQMRAWRAALDRALDGDYGQSLILPAFHDTVQRYGIPARYFHALIDGTEMDLSKKRYETFDELYQYCYRVASVVGFVCLHVWGFDAAEGKALEYAEACGLAFQLTNILRDVKEDAERDRIYLPQEDLRRFGVAEENLKRGLANSPFRALMRFEVERAQGYYDQAQALLPLIHAPGRPTFAIMFQIYRGILDSIERNDYDVFSRRARVSTPKKLGIVARAWLASRLNLRSGIPGFQFR
ncbi:MAG TPA: phytoene/squalene synthase family protein [Chthonomonadaceae bacterium]|nr:phytoene/squalene synthase family protein [Chthonomonadaceae bacterium]